MLILVGALLWLLAAIGVIVLAVEAGRADRDASPQRGSLKPHHRNQRRSRP